MTTQTDKFGTVTHSDGSTITLIEQAYCANHGTDGGIRYYAHGVDALGNRYKVAWDTTAEYDAAEAKYRAGATEWQDWLADESNACNWDLPAEIILTDLAGDY